jgi:hypothetical protein
VSLSLLAGDERGDLLVLKPAEEAAEFGPKDRLVGEAGEERLNGVQHDPLRADAVDRCAQPDEEAFEIILSGLVDLAPLHAHMVDRQLPGPEQPGDVEAQRGDVGAQLLGGLLEAHEHTGLVELGDAPDEELHGEEGFAGSRRAADQRRPPPGQPTLRDLIEPLDAGGALHHAGVALRGLPASRHGRSFLGESQRSMMDCDALMRRETARGRPATCATAFMLAPKAR